MTSQEKRRVPAVQGWFETESNQPHLVGSQCTSCRSYFFPKESMFCRNPSCPGGEFEEVCLSRTGTLWSFTNNCYRPPPPYVSPDPFEPYAIAAVELPKEKMVVLGQVVPGVEVTQLKAGMEMELVVGTLYEDEQNEYVVWKWKPTGR
jgi:uncharacterized OB-fold protein